MPESSEMKMRGYMISHLCGTSQNSYHIAGFDTCTSSREVKICRHQVSFQHSSEMCFHKYTHTEKYLYGHIFVHVVLVIHLLLNLS